MANDFSFFIYDYESFGINPASDRPAQFAGIRTDADFNIIGEPVMLYCKQTNDYLPAPESVMVTGITPQECNEKGIPEPEFAAKILAEFSQPNTCVMGYNNIRYDDEMTRYTFYRNFIDPYEYSWKNNDPVANFRIPKATLKSTCKLLRAWQGFLPDSFPIVSIFCRYPLPQQSSERKSTEQSDRFLLADYANRPRIPSRLRS